MEWRENARLHARKRWVKSEDDRGCNVSYVEAVAFTDGFNMGWKAGRRSKGAED